MELKESIDYLKNCLDDKWDFKNATREKDKQAIDTVLNRLEDLENRYLHLIIGGRTYQILNDVKKLSYTEFEDGEVILEVLEKWN